MVWAENTLCISFFALDAHKIPSLKDHELRTRKETVETGPRERSGGKRIYLASVRGHGEGQPCMGQLERIHLQLPSQACSSPTLQPLGRKETVEAPGKRYIKDLTEHGG